MAELEDEEQPSAGQTVPDAETAAFLSATEATAGEPAPAEATPASGGESVAATAQPSAPAVETGPAGGESRDLPAIAAIHQGQIVEGTVVRIEDDHLLVDVGYKSDGTIPLAEVRLQSDQTLRDAFTVGQRIAVTVLDVDGQDGGVVLSHRRAVEAQSWKRLEEAHRSGEVITAPVTDQVKGGLVIDVGLRGFMPASQVERGYVNDLAVYVGHPIRAKVIEIDHGKNRVILSQKAVLEDEHQRMRDRTWADLAEGQVRRGVVKGLTDFGAFVDLGGVDGLLHVSEMAWGRVDHPSDVLNVGDEINVKILRLDQEKEKISLGLKQVLPDPWETAEQRYPVDAIVDGKVMRLAPFGAFVQLEPGVEGLVHISQLADYHVGEPSEVVHEGQPVRVKILRVAPLERRISLSLRDAERQRERPNFHQGATLSTRSEPVTLGDMFGRLFDQARERMEDDGPDQGRDR